MKALRFLDPLVNPAQSWRLLGKLTLPLTILALAALTVGIVWGLFIAPVDYQQGHSYRIIYVHVPMAFLAQSIYMFIAANALGLLIWKVKFCDWAMEAAAPIGAAVCFFAIASGAIWGKPTWGTWWVWDARLTSMLVLLLLYAALISLRTALPRAETAAKMCAWLALIGVINIPIIKFSVDWWFTLHQPATLKLTGSSTIHPSMLWPLLWMIASAYLWFAAALVARLRTVIVARESAKKWVEEL